MALGNVSIGRTVKDAAASTSTTGPASFMIIDPDGNPILIDQHVEVPANYTGWPCPRSRAARPCAPATSLLRCRPAPGDPPRLPDREAEGLRAARLEVAAKLGEGRVRVVGAPEDGHRIDGRRVAYRYPPQVVAVRPQVPGVLADQRRQRCGVGDLGQQ